MATVIAAIFIASVIIVATFALQEYRQSMRSRRRRHHG